MPFADELPKYIENDDIFQEGGLLHQYAVEFMAYELYASIFDPVLLGRMISVHPRTNRPYKLAMLVTSSEDGRAAVYGAMDVDFTDGAVLLTIAESEIE